LGRTSTLWTGTRDPRRPRLPGDPQSRPPGLRVWGREIDIDQQGRAVIGMVCVLQPTSMKLSAKGMLLVAGILTVELSGNRVKKQRPMQSIEPAQAKRGQPATPTSVAGVARLTTHGAWWGGAAVGAVATGTACVLVNGAYVWRLASKSSVQSSMLERANP